MRCIGTTRDWLFFEHASSVVAVDAVSLDTTGVIAGDAAAALIASAAEQEWRPAEQTASFNTAFILASSAFADCLPPNPSFPLPMLASLNSSGYAVPEDVSACVKRALKWRRDYGRGGTDKICTANARVLAQGGVISLDKVRNVALHWATGAEVTAKSGWEFGSDGYPSTDRIDWDLWGGDSGRQWAHDTLTAALGYALLAAAYDVDADVVESDATEDEPDPQDPLKDHQFEPEIGGVLCMYCGKTELDEIHDFLAPTYSVLDVDPDKAHFFVEESDDENSCAICGRDVGHDLHKQAALASYYEFQPLYDEIYAADAEWRKKQQEIEPAPEPVTAGGMILVRPEDEDPVERAALAREDAEMLFWQRQGTEEEDPLTYFVSSANEDEMVVDGIYVFDGQTFYQLDLDQRLWVPTPLPAGEHIYPIDDESAYVTINALLFSPEPFDLHEVDPGESYLMDSCVPHVDLDTLERSLVSDVGPPTSPPPATQPQGGPWDGYTPQERAKNASRQGRDNSGKFAPGGGSGSDSVPGGAPKPGGKSKATLTAPRAAMTATELQALFDGFATYVEQQRAADAGVPPPQTAAAAAPPPATPPAPAAAPVTDDVPTTSPEQSDVKPINLAVMDPGDPSAVLDLISLVPASAHSAVPKLFKRVPGGLWKEDLLLLRQMQSLHPPLVQTLDDSQYGDVLNQVDQFYIDEGASASLIQMYGPRGELLAGGFSYPTITADGSADRSDSVIVGAVPSDSDPIRGASSEKVPHLTLLFFGPAEGANMDGIRAAVADAARAADGPITLSVTKREKLGDDDADVLMLDAGGTPLIGLRDKLLAQPPVKDAYDAVEQYPEYLPHLTLGYPDNPAIGEPPGEITFDRLALWDDDYAGEEFPLGGGDPVRAAGIPGIADTPSDIAAVEKLKRYWTIGKGGTIKIRWNTPGDWTRCNKHLRKYMGPRAKGYCANLHKAMTGVWPGDRRNIGKRNRSRFSSLGDSYDVLSSADVITAAAAFAEFLGEPAPLTAAAVADKGGAHFIIPMLAPVGVKSGDGREFAPNSLTHRELPIPLLWQIKTQNGHDESVIVGRIDSIDKLEGGALGNARGVFDIGPYAKEAERMVRDKFLRGVSVDLDEFEAESKDDGGDDDESGIDISKIAPGKMRITGARAMAATLVAKPAFQECTIELDDDDAEEITMVADGTYIADPSTDEEYEALVQSALVAAGIPLHPPREWFNDPKLTEKTPLTVHEDGRVFGHIATWDVDHIGLPFSTRPPKSSSNYAYFHTGVLKTDDGSDVPVGQITLVGGHADLRANAAAAARHYDDTASAFCDVRIGEDRHGIWASGALRTTVNGDQLRAIRASAPSGDWRPINGRLELVAVCQVNTPGFPNTRAMVAGGQMYALVAAGTAVLNRMRADRAADPDGLSVLSDRLSVLESEHSAKIEAARAAAIDRIAPARAAVVERHREHMAQLSARVDPVRQEREERTRQTVAALVERITAADLESFFADYSTEKRDEYAKKGWALSDGSYPIANVADLRRAISAYGRAKQKAPVRRHIRKRAKALGKSELIPESWGEASIMAGDGFDEITEMFGPLIAAGGRYPDGTPWDPKNHPRDETGRFRQAIARIRQAAVKARHEEIIDAADIAQKAEESGNLDKAQEAARRVLKRVDAEADAIGDPDTARELREGYTDLGTAVANLPLTMGDLNEKFRFSELPPDLQELVRDLLTRIETRLEPEHADKASAQIKDFIAGVDLLSQPEISAELSRMLRYLI